jgi:hypothetical protein
MAASMKMAIFSYVALCRLVETDNYPDDEGSKLL